MNTDYIKECPVCGGPLYPHISIDNRLPDGTTERIYRYPEACYKCLNRELTDDEIGFLNQLFHDLRKEFFPHSLRRRKP